MSEKIKVRIKQFDERPSHWANTGDMDELMGQEIEVELRRNDNDLYYFDDGEASWSFHGSDFEAMEPVGLRQDSFKPASPDDTQIGGSHYTDMSIEPWEVIERANLDYWDGNAIKYVMRYGSKNGVEDLKKAIHYIEKKISILENK